MNMLAAVVGLIVLAQGLVGISLPGSLTTIGRQFLSPTLVYSETALHVTLGVMLIVAAPKARLPQVLRVTGFVMVAWGILMPGIGPARMAAMVDWWLGRGTPTIRFGAFAVAAVGGLLVYGSTRRETVPETFANARPLSASAPTSHPQTIAR